MQDGVGRGIHTKCPNKNQKSGNYFEDVGLHGSIIVRHSGSSKEIGPEDMKWIQQA
jgi:hypothetical protein